MTDLFSDRTWFTVVAKLGRSEEVHRRLEEQGYRSFLPLCIRERRHAGKVEEVVRPLFDRYQFVGVDFDQAFTPICNTLGVAFVMRGFGQMPLRVSPIVLRRVKARCDADGGMVDFRPRQPEGPVPAAPLLDWEPGQMLDVIDGPFRDFSATLIEWADKRREMARVLVNIFGRTTPLEAPVSALRMAAEARAA